MKLALLLVTLAIWPFGSAWNVAETIEDRRFEAFDAASLNLYDFDGDGRQEVVSSNDNGRVYVLSATSGRILAQIATTHPEGWAARDINPVAIGDLYGDGTPCMVIPNSAAYLAAWCYQRHDVLGGFKFVERWKVRVDAAQGDPDFLAKRPWLKDQQPSIDGNAFLADVDGKPGLEVFVETDGYPGQFSFTHDGKLRWAHASWDGNAGVQVADLDADGRKEAVFASDAGVIAVYDADAGNLEWTFDASKNGATPGSIPVSPTIADLDGDGKLEIVFGARQAVDDGAGWQDRSHAAYFALAHDGRMLWRASHAWMNPLTYNRPVALDVDGDGVRDVLAMDWNTAGHNPGNWETTSRPTNLFALSGRDGHALWRRPVSVYWSNKDFVVADVAGDGDPEIVANMEKDGRDGLGVFDAATGREVGWHPVAESPWEVMRGPVAGDVDADGDIDLVVPIARKVSDESPRGLDVGVREGAIVVLDTREAGRVWHEGSSLHTDEARPAGPGVSWLTGWRGAVTAAGIGIAIASALLVARGRERRL